MASISLPTRHASTGPVNAVEADGNLFVQNDEAEAATARAEMDEPINVAKGTTQVFKAAVGVSTWLVVWSLVALMPHASPFSRSIALDLTLLSWHPATYILNAMLGIVLVVLLVDGTRRRFRPLGMRVVVLVAAAIALSITAMVYLAVLDDKYSQEMVNGRLRLCYDYCGGTPYAPCVHEPASALDARAPAQRAAEAVSFFRASVYGAPLGVVATLSGDSVDVVFGSTGRAECAVSLPVPSSPSAALLVVDGLGRATAALAARHGLAAVGLPRVPPAACGATGQIAVEAAAANAVAAALSASNRSVSLYGCSRSGKIAVWAAATAAGDHAGLAYDRVLADSPGTLVASARQVQHRGEPFGALVSRWPGWLGRNASASRYVRAWPANVDAGDLVLAACAAGTRYALSSSLDDLWNNARGLRVTVEAARAAGCAVDHVEADGQQHCQLFF